MNPSPDAYEKLGAFYLGREYDLERGAMKDELLLYDSKDLTTHAMCVGMTGSGKTGLCVGLLEEAAIDGVPALIIDPKGDLTNLLLTFPDLRPKDFAPWVDPDDAQRQGMTPDQFARAQAKLWRDGLGSWGQDGERIRRLRAAADFAVYTPGSESGRPLSILSSFAAPGPEVMADADLCRDQISSAATSLLGLMGIDADPLRSREHILLSTIIDHTWRQGQDLDLGRLIQLIQSPPIQRVGVLDLDSFFPPKDRFDLALALNNLLAAPGFGAWMTGESIDPQHLLYDAQGKPRVSIVYIAHLSDEERMFVVTLLLNRLLGWMRTRSGTTSLRALLYMDEIFGYMPPVAEPPSKKPLLTLLKQARAFGVGVVMATQNPVDLDYKGLSNTGTWFLGRLQTERDKRRVLDGLEGVAATAATRFDRGAMEETLAGLGKRVFLMHNVHEDGPVIFHTRWAMSYLRGPLTRSQLRRLTQADTMATPIAESAAPVGPGPAVRAAPTTAAQVAADGAPVLPPGVPQCHLPIRGTMTSAQVVYLPRVVASADVHFVDSRRRLDAEETLTLMASSDLPAASGLDWDDAATLKLAPGELLSTAPVPGRFAAISGPASQARSYATWKRSLAAWLYRTRRYELFRCPALKQYSEPGESEAEFRIRLSERAHEERDLQVEKLRKKYASKFNSIRERIRKAELSVEREREQARGATLQTAISVGTTVLAAILGRKLSSSTIGKATTAARGAGRAMTQAQDVGRARANVEAAEEQLVVLETEFEGAVNQIRSEHDPARLALDVIALKPRKTDIEIKTLALGWVPHEQAADGSLTSLVASSR